MHRKVQLFATCLGENFQPRVLRQMVRILERLGIDVEFPEGQTCCGQPLYNTGFQHETRRVARHFLNTFADSDLPLVAPSGSCVDMVRHHYASLFPEGSPEGTVAREVASRTFEFSEFLVNHLEIVDVGATFLHRVTYHASCHLLRGLGLRQPAKQLLQAVRGLELVPLQGEESCCGFGGTFSVIYPEVSEAMMRRKVEAIIASSADAVVAGDAGCVMNIAGGLRRAGSNMRALHLIEVLAGEDSVP